MACYSPIQAFKLPDDGADFAYGPQQSRPIYFSPDKYHTVGIRLPCGQCIGCRLERSRQWATRLVHEAQCHSESMFLTLTYDDEHLPRGGTLVPRHFQLFMKRLRKAVQSEEDVFGRSVGRVGFRRGVRFFHCGEYGDRSGRPHYHALIFGFEFADKCRKGERGGRPVYVSALAGSLWTFGIHEFSSGVQFESAAYVARYVVKKVTGDRSEAHYGGRVPEYTTMSRNPGIGAPWLYRYMSEVYPADRVVVRGREAKPPRFYDGQFELVNPAGALAMSRKRALDGGERFAKAPDEASWQRLKVKEAVKWAETHLYNRKEL